MFFLTIQLKSHKIAQWNKNRHNYVFVQNHSMIVQGLKKYNFEFVNN